MNPHRFLFHFGVYYLLAVMLLTALAMMGLFTPANPLAEGLPILFSLSAAVMVAGIGLDYFARAAREDARRPLQFNPLAPQAHQP